MCIFTLHRQVKETAMAEPEKLPETSEEVRHRKNHGSPRSSELLVAEDIDGWTFLSLYSKFFIVFFIYVETLQHRSFYYMYISFVGDLLFSCEYNSTTVDYLTSPFHKW